jgi:hypothetical protein
LPRQIHQIRYLLWASPHPYTYIHERTNSFIICMHIDPLRTIQVDDAPPYMLCIIYGGTGTRTAHRPEAKDACVNIAPINPLATIARSNNNVLNNKKLNEKYIRIGGTLGLEFLVVT